jgi:heme-degrading monooxygenase HmoA
VIVAISRFDAAKGKNAEVRAAVEERARRLEGAPGFLGLEVFHDAATFLLFTRWCDESALRASRAGAEQAAAHATELFVGTRLERATSDATAEAGEGELVLALVAPLSRLLREGATMHVAIVDAEGTISYANAALSRSCGGDVVGRSLGSLLIAASDAALTEHVAAGLPTALLVQLAPAGGEPTSLRVFTLRMPGGFALVGEPPWDDHRELEERLGALNTELAVLSRDHVRQARLLAKANRELYDSQWHLQKIAEVLPICLSCRAVKTGEHTWEEVASFLARSSDFLSHGYCAQCAEKVAAAMPEET